MILMPFTAEKFDRQEFKAVVCPNADLRDREFTDCVFSRCDLSGCNLGGCRFSDCRFLHCDLSNIKVEGCGFQGVRFEECKLLGVVFGLISPFLLEWEFSRCLISFSVFDNLPMKGGKFLDCDIRGTDFVGCNLQGADFSGSDLGSSRFQDDDLTRADFTKARGYFIDPKQNKLKGARFTYPGVLALLMETGIEIEY